MKQTSGSVFLDTNILIYCYSDNEPIKKEKALEVANNQKAVISTQVINELINTLKKKFGLSYSDISNLAVEIVSNYNVIHVTPQISLRACSIAETYKTSFYDACIISAALHSDCKTLYSEDMHNRLIIEDSLTIINPFK